MPQPTQCASRKAITARTRRWSSPVSGRLSLVKMLRTCFSTVPSVTQSRCAIPVFDRPSAISASTSCSRAVHRERVVAPTSRHQLLYECRIHHRRALGDTLQRLDEVRDVGYPALEQIADAAPAGQQLHRVLDVDVGREHDDGRVG